jgi:hypothetical protein
LRARHEELQPIELFGSEAGTEFVSGGSEGCSAGEMDQQEMFIFEDVLEFDEIVPMEVIAGLSPFAMSLFDKGAFQDQYFCFADAVEFEEIAVSGVAAVADEGDFDVISKFRTVFSEFGQFIAGKFEKFGFEFLTDFDDAVAEAGSAVNGFKGSSDQTPADEVFFTRFEADDAVGGSMAFDFAPDIHEAMNGVYEFSGDDDISAVVVEEISLREIIGDTGGVVHMAMSEQDIIDVQDFAGGTSDVETGVQFGDADDTFFACQGIADKSKFSYL